MDYPLFFEKHTHEKEFILLQKLKNCPRVIRPIVYRDGILKMEYANGGDLIDFIQKQPSITEPDLFHIIEQITDALSSIHQYHIYHLDLKLENIVLNHSIDKLALVDFGMSQESTDGMCSGYQGTPGTQRHGNIPREVVDWEELHHVLGDEVSYSGEKVDVFALGQLTQNIIDTLSMEASPSLVNMLQGMRRTARFRYTIRDIKNSPWYLAKGQGNPI